MAGVDSVKIVVPDTDNKDANVILANFMNGQLNKNSCHKLDFTQFHYEDQTNERRKDHKILLAETERVSYVGYNFGGGTTSLPKPSYRYMIGVHKRGRKHMKLINADTFIIKPSFPDDIDRRKPPEETITLPDDKDLSYREKTHRLITTFGSLKKKRTADAMMRSNVDSGIVQRNLSQVADDALDRGVVDKMDTDSPFKQYDEYRPPCNHDASKPSEVYDLNDIMSEEALASLNKEALIFTEATKETLDEWTTNMTYCQFILKHLRILPVSPDARLHKASCLLYLSYMINLYHRKFSDRNKVLLPKEWPKQCRIALISQFVSSEDTEHAIFLANNKKNKDRLAAHIIVACLILDEFELPIDDLSILECHPHKLTQLVAILGCKKRRSKQYEWIDGKEVHKKVVTLNVPLVLPSAFKSATFNARSNKGKH